MAFPGLNVNPRKKRPFYTIEGSNITRRGQTRTMMFAPIKDLLFKLKAGGFLRKNHITIMYPTAMRGLVGLSHSDILAFYNHKIRGLLNSFAGNNPQKVIWFLVTSCALTLALGWKLRTRKKAFKKFGAHFLCPNTKSSLNIPNNYKVLHHYKMKSSMATPDSVIQVSWAGKLYKSGLGQVCAARHLW